MIEVYVAEWPKGKLTISKKVADELRGMPALGDFHKVFAEKSEVQRFAINYHRTKIDRLRAELQEAIDDSTTLWDIE